MTLQELQEHYLEDIKIEEETIDKQSIKLPIILNKYQVYLHKILKELSLLHEKKSEIYHTIMYEYKIGNHKLAQIEWSSTDLKRIIETSVEMRKTQKDIDILGADLRLVEEMINTFKTIGYQIRNYLDFQKLKGM